MVSIVSSYALLVLAFICRTIGAPSEGVARLFGGGSAKSGGDSKRGRERKKHKEDVKTEAAEDDDLMVLTEPEPRQRERKRA
jgi:hypothetical protein